MRPPGALVGRQKFAAKVNEARRGGRLSGDAAHGGGRGSCALAKVDPVKCLPDVSPRLATREIRQRDLPALLPAAWKRARPAVVTTPAGASAR